MASPQASTAMDALGASMSAAESKGDSQHIAALSGFLRGYSRQSSAPQRDLLEGRYQINLSAPLPEFDTKTAQAFAAIDLVDSSRQFFALVCRPGSVQRHRAVQPLKAPHPNLLPLMAAGVIALSQPEEERFVIVYQRPPGKKLSALIAERAGTMNETFLCRNIVAPIAAAIHHLSTLDIPHGSIHPDNIYYHETPMLGDCISMPCGYDQPFHFETLERQQALPAGKGEGNAAQDFYALAVLVLHMLHGPKHFGELPQEKLLQAILNEGAYAALTRGKQNPEVFDDFFRGVLSQKADDRWDYNVIRAWLDGKRYNVLLPPQPIAAIRPFEFAGLQANNRRQVAHLLYTNWDQIPSVLESGQLAQWITVSLRNKELSETVLRLSRSAMEAGAKNEAQYGEPIMRILMLLDPDGPIRIGPLSMHADGIDTLAGELAAVKADKDLHLLAKFIELNMLSHWLDYHRKESNYVIPNSVNAVLIKLDKLRLCIRNTGLGFGLERMLYDLSPEASCQSPLFRGQFTNNLSAMLVKLDQLAPMLANDQDPMDRHIAAFIASKMNIQYEIKLHEVAGVPALANSRSVIALKLLAMAQNKIGNIQLPGLTHWLALRVAPALDALRSKILRSHMKTLMISRAQSGSLEALANLIINPEYATADQQGFSEAWSLFQSNARSIAGYRKGENIDHLSNGLGLAMSKLFAYAALLITIFSVMQER